MMGGGWKHTVAMHAKCGISEHGSTIDCRRNASLAFFFSRKRGGSHSKEQIKRLVPGAQRKFSVV